MSRGHRPVPFSLYPHVPIDPRSSFCQVTQALLRLDAKSLQGFRFHNVLV